MSVNFRSIFLSNVRTTAFRGGFPDTSSSWRIYRRRALCVQVLASKSVAGECKTESLEPRESTLPLPSISLSLFSQVVFPVLSRSSRVYAGRASRYVGRGGRDDERSDSRSLNRCRPPVTYGDREARLSGEREEVGGGRRGIIPIGIVGNAAGIQQR